MSSGTTRHPTRHFHSTVAACWGPRIPAKHYGSKVVRRHWLTRLSDERTASLRTFWGAFEPLPPHPVGDCTLTAYRRQLHHHFAESTTKRCHRMHRGLATHTPPFHLIGCMLLAWICDPLSAQDLAAVAAVIYVARYNALQDVFAFAET